MGEAKWRRENDPMFGKAPRVAKKRGLVVSNPVTVDLQSNRLEIAGGRIDPQELRFALMFWDLLAWPRNGFIGMAGGDDEQFLEQCGVLMRPFAAQPGPAPAADWVVNAQLSALKELDRQEPGCWALAQGEKALNIVGGLEGEHGAMEVSLRRAIPIPNHDVPLAEILELKERRKDELLALRAHLDMMIADVQASPDDPTDALAARLGDVDAACSDLLKLGKEWQFPVHLADLQTSVNLNPVKIGGTAFGAYKGALEVGMSQSTSIIAGVAGGLASTIDVKGRPQLKGWRRPKSPFRYAYHLNVELK